MAMINEMEKKNVKIDEDYFEIAEKEEEEYADLGKMEKPSSVDIKIDENYIKSQEESIEGKDTTFSEDEVELKNRVKKLEKELAGITVPGFAGLWKAHSSAFNDCKIRGEEVFRVGSILSIGRTSSEGKPSAITAAAGLPKRKSESVRKTTACNRGRIGEEMCKSIDIEDDEHDSDHNNN